MMESKDPAAILPVVKTAFLCACCALALSLVDGRLSILPLGFFVAACLAAPFFPRIGFFLPLISRGSRKTNSVALTFDDGPDPDTTPLILELLKKHNAPATFFLIGEKAEKHPELVKMIIAAGHELGNHSMHHDPLLMLRSSQRIHSEIVQAQNVLKAFGVQPWAFRPPVGITNPKLGRILKKLNLSCVTFSCRGFDAGNRRIRGLSKKILGKVKDGDIVLLHDIRPKNNFPVEALLMEMEKILQGLSSKNIKTAGLSKIL